ncbi:hypothetical protein PENTCL1PPCAC_13165, partial [Pristionchus entomophagus]
SDVALESQTMSEDEFELILEDEASDDVQVLTPKEETVAAESTENQVEEKEDSDIEIVESDEEEPVQTTLLTPGFFQSHNDLRAAANSFFDLSSPTNVANIPLVMRMEMANYARALFEWICCLPTVEILVELPNFANIDLPFPVTPDQKRILIQREYGLRLSDVWRQTKNTVKMANHFK